MQQMDAHFVSTSVDPRIRTSTPPDMETLMKYFPTAAAMKTIGLCAFVATSLAACGGTAGLASADTEPSAPSSTTTVPATTTTVPAPTTTAAPPPSTTTPAPPPSTTTVAPPSSSCDGSTLAVTGRFSGTDSLFLFDLTTESLVDVLPNGPSEPRTPVWSSDCDAIFFVTPGPDDASLVNRLDLESQEVTFVFEHDFWIRDLIVHGDGEVYEFSSTDVGEPFSADDVTYLTRYVAASGEFETHHEIDASTAWVQPHDLAETPSGTLLLHGTATFGGLEIIGEDLETSPVDLGDLPLSPFGRDCCEISPNGQRVAVETALGGYGDTGSANALALVDLISGDAQVITNGDEYPWFDRIASPAWSSDSSQVVFLEINERWDFGPDCDLPCVFIEGTITLWLATDGNAEAVPLASFDMDNVFMQGEVAWMPNS